MKRILAALAVISMICSANAAAAGSPTAISAGAVLTSADLAGAVERALAGQTEGRLKVTLDNRNINIRLERPDATVTLEDLDYNRGGRRFRGNIAVVADGRVLQSFTVAGTALPILAIPVLAAPLGADERIRPENIAYVELSADQVGRDVVLDAGQLQGMTTKRTLAADQPIRTRDVQVPLVVEKNAMVTLVVQTPAMTLTAKGKALDAGGIGQTVRVQNSASKRIVEGVVTGSGQVTVPTGSQQIQAMN